LQQLSFAVSLTNRFSSFSLPLLAFDRFRPNGKALLFQDQAA